MARVLGPGGPPRPAGARGLTRSPLPRLPRPVGSSHGAQPEWHDPEAPLPQGLAAARGHVVQPAGAEDPQVSRRCRVGSRGAHGQVRLNPLAR